MKTSRATPKVSDLQRLVAKVKKYVATVDRAYKNKVVKPNGAGPVDGVEVMFFCERYIRIRGVLRKMKAYEWSIHGYSLVDP